MGPLDRLQPFLPENIFLLTIAPVNKYFFRVPAHRYFQISSHRRKVFWGDDLTGISRNPNPTPSSAKSDGANYVSHHDSWVIAAWAF
jgi:hypothetical protein